MPSRQPTTAMRLTRRMPTAKDNLKSLLYSAPLLYACLRVNESVCVFLHVSLPPCFGPRGPARHLMRGYTAHECTGK